MSEIYFIIKMGSSLVSRHGLLTATICSRSYFLHKSTFEHFTAHKMHLVLEATNDKIWSLLSAAKQFLFLDGFFFLLGNGRRGCYCERGGEGLKQGLGGLLNDCNVLGVSPSLFDNFLRGSSKRRQHSKFKGIYETTLWGS